MPRGRLPVPINVRFWSKVQISQACWLWTGSTDRKGYGFIGTGEGNRMFRAHRYSYELAYGPITPGLLIDHICHTPSCVRPDHLREVTNKQNAENVEGAQRDSKSGVRGVWWDKDANKWRAAVRHNMKLIHVGYFQTLEDADSAVTARRNELFTHNDIDRRRA